MARWDGNKDRTELIGATVWAFRVEASDQETAWLVTDRGVYELATFADCCSETWWADAIGVKQMLGAQVVSIEDIDMPDGLGDDGRTRQAFDEVYGIRITTSGGVCDLIYRNSSNGYYGGSSDERWTDAPVPADAIKVTEDWSA